MRNVSVDAVEGVVREVFADPDQGNATMFAPSAIVAADGRHGRLSGRWAFTSNCLHRTWAGRRGNVDEDPIGMAELGSAGTELRSVRAGLHEARAAADERAERGTPSIASARAASCSPRCT
jgi:hypothetical protein